MSAKKRTANAVGRPRGGDGEDGEGRDSLYAAVAV